MQHTKTVEEFARHNDGEFRRLVASICAKQCIPVHQVDDIVQDMYFRFLTSSVYEKFDPNYHNQSPKISTYLYPILVNAIKSQWKKPHMKIEARRYIVPEDAHENYSHEDNVEIALRSCKVSATYQGILEHNASSDSVDGLAAELEEFEKKWLSKRSRNRHYKLGRRRDKSVGKSGCSLLDVYRLIDAGLTNKQVAEIYGVSSVFVSSMKRMIVQALREYGINWPE